VEPFADLQARLGDVLALNRPNGTIEHVLVALPSYSVGESLLSHYADRIPALEHRYLLAALMLHRIPACHMVFISSAPPGDEVLDHYASLVPPEHHDALRRRLQVLTVPDRSPRSVATKLLEHPELLEQLRHWIAGRPAFIEPWNVTEAEVEVARRLGAPINGTAPELWPLGFKSAGRRLFAESGVPMPAGHEDVRTVDDAVEAVADLRRRCPTLSRVVLKHDDSGAGDGNVVVELPDDERGWLDRRRLRDHLQHLAPWYLADLTRGGVVEELVQGRSFRSPSVQVDLLPSGEVAVLATHEQVLGGVSGQVYTGCRFPADPAYAAELARHGAAVGRALARRGATGRASIDFAVASDDDVAWRVLALEVNLRKGGTTHPYAALRNLVPGRYQPDAGRWQAGDGTARSYWATDNLVVPALTGASPTDVIGAVERAGVRFDHRTGTGVVLHMLSCLAVDGRLGLTAIGTGPEQAAQLYRSAEGALEGMAVPS
jgi:hypothetical protein